MSVVHFRDLPPDEQARMRAHAKTPEGRVFAAECEADAAYWDSLTDDERDAEFDRIMAEGAPVEVHVSPDLRVILLPDGWPDDAAEDTP